MPLGSSPTYSTRCSIAANRSTHRCWSRPQRTRSSLDQAFGDDDDVSIAAITAAELWVGVELADARRGFDDIEGLALRP
jgi:hypothetical protein